MLKRTIALFGLISLVLFTNSSPLLAQGEETAGTTPIVLVEEAYLAHRQGDYEKAIDGYTKIIQRRGLTKRERAISYLLRGEAKRDADLLSESLQDFTRALRQWPGYPQAHFFRGRIYEELGQLKEAYADLTRANQLDPTKKSYITYLAALRKKLESSGVNVLNLGVAPEPVTPEMPLGE